MLVLCCVLQIEKEEQAAAEKAAGKEEYQGEWTAPVAEFVQPEVTDWSEGVQVPSVPIQQFAAAATGKNLAETLEAAANPYAKPATFTPETATSEF